MGLFVLGVLLMGFTSTELPWLILPALVLTGNCGLSFLLSNMQVAVFLQRGSSIYIGILAGFFDASIVTQLIVKILFENGIQRIYSYGGVAVLCVIISGICTALHPTAEDFEELKARDYTIDNETNSTEKRFTENDLKDEESTSKKDNSSLYSILRSRMYILHVLWNSILVLMFLYFLGSINTRIEQIVDNKDDISYFTNMMSYIMFGGLISSYLAGQFSKLQKSYFRRSLQKVMPLTVTSLLAVLLSSLVFVSSADWLYSNFVVVTFLRSFIFSNSFDFIVATYPFKYISVLNGLTGAVSGLFSLSQYALYIWTDKYDEAMTHVNLVLLGLTLLSLIHPLFIVVSSMRIEKNDSESSSENTDKLKKENNFKSLENEITEIETNSFENGRTTSKFGLDNTQAGVHGHIKPLLCHKHPDIDMPPATVY